MSTSPMPLPSEVEICKRVAAVRKLAGLNQQALADQIGVTRAQLASIETARRELRFRVGWNICKALNLSQWYLAMGDGPKHPFHDFDPDKIAGRVIRDSASFGAVCANRLASELKSRNEGLTGVSGIGNTPNVKAQWPLLKKRLQKATEATGGKSRLAEFLGVKLSNVSQWLTNHKNAREPGAETALRMLHWVEHQERK